MSRAAPIATPKQARKSTRRSVSSWAQDDSLSDESQVCATLLFMNRVEAALPFAQLVVEVNFSIEAAKCAGREFIQLEAFERVQQRSRQEFDTRGFQLLAATAVEVVVQRLAGVEFSLDAV